MRKLNGEAEALREIDKVITDYTSKRIREMLGETAYWVDGDDTTARYCRLRIRETKVGQTLRDNKLLLDNRKLGSYTVSTMGDHSG
tara:strand:+ start:8203 stop:8460 length:258 start_codon:yes stop_codon:yes gene_type:complete